MRARRPQILLVAATILFSLALATISGCAVRTDATIAIRNSTDSTLTGLRVTDGDAWDVSVPELAPGQKRLVHLKSAEDTGEGSLLLVDAAHGYQYVLASYYSVLEGETDAEVVRRAADGRLRLRVSDRLSAPHEDFVDEGKRIQ